jgi:hypothetical protein
MQVENRNCRQKVNLSLSMKSAISRHIGFLLFTYAMLQAAVTAEPIPTTVNLQYQNQNTGQEGHLNLRVRIPMTQDKRAFWFLEPHLKRFDSNTLGGSVIVGWRRLNQQERDIIGSFIAYDYRNYQAVGFHQVSAGVEYKTESASIYLTGFVPLGKGQGSSLGNLIASNFFDGTTYVFERRQRFGNAPLAGLELGGDIVISVGQDSLRHGAAVYYLDDATVGVRGKLNYESSLINAGLSSQSDRLFGTAISFYIGFNFVPVPRTPKSPEIKDRIYEPVNKPSTIIIKNEPQGIGDIVAINPDTNQPYSFYVVTNNPAGLAGNPVVEPPTVAGLTNALTNANNAGGNGVVYVYQANSALPVFNSNFTVGDGTKLVSSSAPVAAFFNRSLPFIALRGVGGVPVDFDNFLVVNDGQPLPQINGNITLTGGNRQAVVGFNITPTGRAVDGNNNSNALILSNIVNNAVDDAIRLQTATNLTQVVNNQITGNIGAGNTNGIRITQANGNVISADNTVNNTTSTTAQARAISIETIGNTNSVTVLNSNINNTQGVGATTGIDVRTNGGDINTVTIGGINTVNTTVATGNTGASGIAVLTDSANTIQTVNISGTNTIDTTIANFNNGSGFALAVTTNQPNSSINQVNISANNNINNTNGNAPINANAGGIAVFANANNTSIGSVNITGNNNINATQSLDQAGGIGVVANGNNSSIGSVNITGNNTISNTIGIFRAIGLAIGANGANAQVANGGVINITGNNTITNTNALNIAVGAGILTNFLANGAQIAQNGTINISNLSVTNTNAVLASSGLGITPLAPNSSIAGSGNININNTNIQNVSSGLNSAGIGIATSANNQTIGNINVAGTNTIQNISATGGGGLASGISVRVPDAAVNTTLGNITIGDPALTTSVQNIQALQANGRAYGIEVKTAIATTAGNVTVRNAQVSTTAPVVGRVVARGIYVEAGSTANNPAVGSMGNVEIINNVVGSPATPVQMTDPSFRDAIGILVRAINNNTIGNTRVANNNINGVIATAQGRAQGIVVNSFTSNVPFAASPLIGTVGSIPPTVIIENNTVNAGNATTLTTDGILLGTEIFNFVPLNNPQVGRAVIRNNTVSVVSNNLVGQSGATGIKIYNDNDLPPALRNHVNVDILNNTITFTGGNFAPTGSPADGSSSGIFIQANTGTPARPVCVQIANNSSTTTNIPPQNAHYRFLNVANGVALLNASPDPLTSNAQIATFLGTVGNTIAGGGSFAFSNNPTIPAINSTICPNY